MTQAIINLVLLEQNQRYAYLSTPPFRLRLASCDHFSVILTLFFVDFVTIFRSKFPLPLFDDEVGM